LTLPNKLTVVRIVLTFVIMGLLFVPGQAAKTACLMLFGVAALTDWWDGWLARKTHQISTLGILLDPIADKVLVIGLLMAFVQLGLVRAWMVLVIACREFFITGIRLYAASHHVVIAAAKEGKHKTVSQMGTILVILLLLLMRERRPAEALESYDVWMSQMILGCMWVTVTLTMWSGGMFFWKNRVALREAVSR
jgi:CDP-diacylglycerol--glycerol-3-phosphate 3-phosphatidyltransferase